MDFAIRRFGGTGAPKDIRSCIGWVVQDPRHVVVLDRSLMGATSDPSRKEQMLLVEVAHGRKAEPVC